MKKWSIFIKERFDPASHLIMIVVFMLVHYLIAKKVTLLQISTFEIILLFIGVTIFYFKLRLYDEVKDYELDVVINKSRPLPRGLLNHQDMYNGMIFCILLEVIIFSIQGINSLASILIAISYSLLMYKEFFIKEKIRPHLTTYAIMHTIVTTILSLAIFSFLTKDSFFNIIKNKYFIVFAIVNWLLFNVFEFGRKTFAKSEERDHVDTYSSLFGKYGAATLVFSQQLISVALILALDIFQSKLEIVSFLFLFIFLFIITARYIFLDNPKSAKLFRTTSSIYIIVFYLILAIGLV